MIKTQNNDRSKYIGGSEANNIYFNYEAETFKKWWAYKLTEIPKENNVSNLAMSVGTILEHEIINLYENTNKVIGVRDEQKIKGIARANTDYLVSNKIYDVKATKKAVEWYLSDAVPIAYRRQLTHYLYVFELQKAGIIAYLVDEELLNPFMELKETKLFVIDVEITEKQIMEHKQRIEYLEFCKEMNIFPR